MAGNYALNAFKLLFGIVISLLIITKITKFFLCFWLNLVARFLFERLSGIPANSLFPILACSEVTQIRLLASTSRAMQSLESNSRLGNICPIRLIFRHSTWEPTEVQWRHALSCVPSKEQEKILRYFHRRDSKASLVNT